MIEKAKKEGFKELCVKKVDWEMYAISIAGRPVGYAGLTKGGEIAGILVDKDYRRKGFGECLVQRIIADARKNGAKELTAWTNPEGAAAELFRHMGFEGEETTNNYGQPVIKFRKSIGGVQA